MATRVLFLLTIVCLHQLNAFVLNKRSSPHSAGANKLADALRVIQTQKRRLSEKQEAEQHGGYYGNGYGWDNRVSMPYLGAASPVDEFGDDAGNVLYEDYDQPSPDALKLLEYYYDLGARSQEPELDGPIPVENNDVTEASQQEIADLLDSDKEKKNIDWTPKALGFEGLKHKRGDSSADDDVTEDSANQATEDKVSDEDEEEKEEEEGEVEQTQLSEEEVNKLLSDVADTEVKSVAKEVHVEDVNGEKTVSEKEIADILKDTDGDGKKEEVILEQEVPPTKVKDINKELLIGQELVGAGMGTSMKQKRAGGFLEEAMRDYEPEVEAYVPTEQDLLRECLIKYIEFEDRENTALAEALNWATKAQYDQTDAYIPMQVEYLRKAVGNEATLSSIRRQCFELANQVDAENQLVNDLEETEEEEAFPLDSGDVIEDEPIIEEGEFLPEGESDTEEDTDTDDFVSAKPRLSKEELADYITSELVDLLSRKQEALDEEDEGDEQWMDNAIDDTAGEEDEESEWQLNPFLRELILQYKKGKLTLHKRTDNDLEDDFEDYELPEESDQLQIQPYIEEDYDSESCPAVEQLTDNCAYARAMGWSLDGEAIQLCNRHLLCYLCGSEHDLSASVCDKGYLGEAYTSCELQDDPQTCMEQADLLFELMYKTHPYSPLSGARYSCKAKCTLDYITGNWEEEE